jgi:hypothetical protein
MNTILQIATSKLHEHLRDRHDLTIALRRTAVEHACSLHVEHDVDRLVPRADGSDIISSLSVHEGFVCLQSRLKTTSEISMIRHLSKCHRLPGSCPSYDDLYEAAKLQTWLSNKRTRYWQAVEPRASSRPSTSGLSTFLAERTLEEIHRREMEYQASMREEDARDTGVQTLELTSPWMNHTQWASRYQSARRDIWSI